ncbi:MAG: sigma 54-interacting transcriptional regulator [Spirochaetales bacterium]|jgi:Nif-specific regulatory protein|nr:sigma 54-interacting transcriptional regulator [Spirochaetales bacterium]
MFSQAIDHIKFQTLIELYVLINANHTDFKGVLARILEAATRLSKGEASALLLVNPENQRLYFEITMGPRSRKVKQYSLGPGEGIAGWVAQHNTSLMVNDVGKDERFFAGIDRRTGFNTDAILAVPLRIEDRCVGVIEIVNRTDKKDFTQEDLQWLEIFATQAALAIQNARSYQKVLEQLSQLKEEMEEPREFHTFVGSSRIIREKLELARRIAGTESSILICGESGVGKELFAEQIHLHSPRREKPFIRVSCAALPETLLESELFGHVRGAFTDASSERRGKFELADGGTIFLDEIGELSPGIQAKLLRVLQERTLEKLGSEESITVDIRIIAATNRDIEKAKEEGSFRADLYYRLNVIPFYVPPLRERPGDILELSEFFLDKILRDTQKAPMTFSPQAEEALLSYNWPGNIRELSNVIERAAVICETGRIEPADLGLGLGEKAGEEAYLGKTLREAVNLFKKQFLYSNLKARSFRQSETAKALGIQRTYLSKLIKDLDIRNSR